MIITDAAFGVVARVVPQLNVFSVGFPAKVRVGLLVLGVSLPFAAGWISDQLQQSVAAALQSLKVALRHGRQRQDREGNTQEAAKRRARRARSPRARTSTARS